MVGRAVGLDAYRPAVRDVEPRLRRGGQGEGVGEVDIGCLEVVDRCRDALVVAEGRVRGVPHSGRRARAGEGVRTPPGPAQRAAELVGERLIPAARNLGVPGDDRQRRRDHSETECGQHPLRCPPVGALACERWGRVLGVPSGAARVRARRSEHDVGHVGLPVVERTPRRDQPGHARTGHRSGGAVTPGARLCGQHPRIDVRSLLFTMIGQIPSSCRMRLVTARSTRGATARCAPAAHRRGPPSASAAQLARPGGRHRTGLG